MKGIDGMDKKSILRFCGIQLLIHTMIHNATEG